MAIATHDNHESVAGQMRWRLGVVSYLNAKPLVFGLEQEPGVCLSFDVPSRLTARLIEGEFDAALIPAIDVMLWSDRLQIISDACIGCGGETLTVRVFSQVPPPAIRRIYIDQDSHTSAVLSQIIWPELFHRSVEFVPLDTRQSLDHYESILLIGDKVVGMSNDPFRYQVDLGGAWKTWTGLPFVFAVWAAPTDRDYSQLGRLLSAARDAGVRRVGQLAVEFGPTHGWSASLAQEYLQRYLQFGMTAEHVEGLVRFWDLARARGLAPSQAALETVS